MIAPLLYPEVSPHAIRMRACYDSLTPAASPQHVVRPRRVRLLHPVLAAARRELCAHAADSAAGVPRAAATERT